MDRSYWDKYSVIYNLFMRKDSKMYQEMFKLIGKQIKGKKVLEVATGTGLIAKNCAEYADTMYATDFSDGMLNKAMSGNIPENLTFARQDACNLTYEDNTYDVVIISNALHIMPNPDKALQEIRRVLKPDGILIAPTFTHGKMKKRQQLLSKAMGLIGFKFKGWTKETYINFIEKSGWKITFTKQIAGWFPLTYVECN